MNGTDATNDSDNNNNRNNTVNSPRRPIAMSRRQLLKVLGLGSASAAVGVYGIGAVSEATRTASSNKANNSNKTTKTPTTAKRAVPTRADQSARRSLVIVELQGGHDGFATLVPYGDGRFRKLRDRIWVDPKELHVLDDRYAVAKGLEPVVKNLAFVEGVGVARPDLSHFAMLQRWWAGDPDGNKNLLTGFLGRCCDLSAGNEPVTGVSIGGGSSPALISAKATTVSMPRLDDVRDFAKDDPDQRRLRQAIQRVAAGTNGFDDPNTDRLLAIARNGLRSGLDLATMVGSVGEKPAGYPDNNDLAAQLASVRELISAGSGVRIFHVPWGSFDTHTNENGTLADHMTRLGAALAAFRDDLASHGLADRVLVATTSEFGRRPEANAGGTDHGTASTTLLMGPVRPGRHGIPVDFSRLDDTGNVKATVGMSDYYATLAHWLGLRPADVLPSPGTVIDTLGL